MTSCAGAGGERPKRLSSASGQSDASNAGAIPGAPAAPPHGDLTPASRTPQAQVATGTPARGGGGSPGGGGDGRPGLSRSEQLRVEAMQSLLTEIFRVAPDDAVAAAAAAAGAAGPLGGEAAVTTQTRGNGARVLSDVEAMIEMIRAEEGMHEEGGGGGAGVGDPDDSDEEDEEDGEEEEDEEEEDDDEAAAGGELQPAQQEAGEDEEEEAAGEELNLEESVERLVEITNIPHEYARVLLAAHDGDLAAAISTVMDVF